MLDLTKEERTLLARLEKADAFIHRQAEDFSLVISGFYVCAVKADICKSLISKHCLNEVGENKKEDLTEWLYGADPILFAPNFELERDSDV